MSEHDLDLDESDRQLVLLALAVLSLESPGMDYALNEIAKRIDNVHVGRAVTYDVLRECRRKPPPPPCMHPVHKALKLADTLDDDG